MDLMTSLHFAGISLIMDLQYWLQNFSGVMIFLSHIGSPPLAFTFFFPVAYCIHPSIGRRVMWVAVVAEWLNAVFKWILHGERPYWWVHESEFLYQERNLPVPHLRQFNITCETGPGSPSGHAMVSSAVMFVFLSDILHYKQVKSKVVHCFCWSVYTCVCVGVCVSRLYIAAHFPHQVVAGFLVGVFMARFSNTISTSHLELKHYVLATSFIAIATVVSYFSLWILNFDPGWSVELAIRRCALREWVYLDTTTFYAIVRDIANLFGLGVATWALRDSKDPDNKSIRTTAVQTVLALSVFALSDHLKVPKDIIPVFYALGFVKHFFTVFVVVYLVSLLKRVSSL